jgi:CheY-like chemotaxis protein
MNVLIIDDTDYKISGLKAVLANCDFVTEVRVAKSFQSGTRALRQFKPDLVLLDMTLPTTESARGGADGRWRLFGGKEVLAEMRFSNIAAKVILITQFDHYGEHPHRVESKTLIAEMKRDFAEIVVGGVYYSNIDSIWVSRLRDMVIAARRNL